MRGAIDGQLVGTPLCTESANVPTQLAADYLASLVSLDQERIGRADTLETHNVRIVHDASLSTTNVVLLGFI